jgi:hypothetical protein
MDKEDTSSSSELSKLQKIDYVVSAAKSALGAVPFVGSLLSELAGTVIPNQRIDRIVKFAEALEQKLARLEHDFVRSQLTNENFTDLLEEGLRQAARALTEERRDYIASIIVNGLTSEDIEYAESKHLLRMLGQINDVEVIWLRFYLEPTIQGDMEFRQKHDAILEPIHAYIGCSQETLDKDSLQQSYKEHLTQLGLLERRYDIDMKTKEPKFETTTGKQKVRGYQITSLGRLLLRQIDLHNITSNDSTKEG